MPFPYNEHYATVDDIRDQFQHTNFAAQEGFFYRVDLMLDYLKYHDKIYQTERWGLNGYSVPVPNGIYTVKLHFAETWSGITSVGQRTFSVNVEGDQLNNLDVFSETGGRQIALVRTFSNVNVNDGKLDITFTQQIGAPIINGIEIIIQSGSSIPVCGNGVVETGEICDDGNLNGQQGKCKNDCSGVTEIPPVS